MRAFFTGIGNAVMWLPNRLKMTADIQMRLVRIAAEFVRVDYGRRRTSTVLMSAIAVERMFYSGPDRIPDVGNKTTTRVEAVARVLVQANAWLSNQRRVDAALRNLRPDVAIMMRDAYGTNEHCVRDTLQRFGLPVALMPVAFAPADQLTLTYGARPDHRLSERQARFVNDRLPGAARLAANGFVGRVPQHRIASMALLKLMPCDPWRVASASPVLVSNAHVDKLLRGDGFAPQRLIVTGHPNYDELHRLAHLTTQERAAARAEFGFDGSRPVVVASIAYDIFKSELYPNRADMQNFEEYIAMVEAVLAPFADKADILVSPHPRLHGDVAKIARLAGLGTLSVKPILPLLAIADGFLGYVGSIVNVDAAKLHVPSVALVIYEGALEQQQTVGAAPGMRAVITVDEARAAYADMLVPGAFQRWLAAASDREELAVEESQMMDGKVGVRIIDALDRLAAGTLPR